MVAVKEHTWVEYDESKQEDVTRTVEFKIKAINTTEEEQVLKEIRDKGGNIENIEKDPYLMSIFKQNLLKYAVVFPKEYHKSTPAIGKLPSSVTNDLFEIALDQWQPNAKKSAPSELTSTNMQER